MFLWLITAITVSQIVILYGLAAPLAMRETCELFLSRNHDWVMQNPAFRQKHGALRYATGLSWLIGAAWLARTFHVASGTDTSDSEQIFLLAGPVFSWVILCVGYGCIAYFRVGRRIPLPTKRSASLERRTLRDYIHPAWVYLGYSLVTAISVLYLLAYMRDTVTADLFVARMSGLALAMTLQTSALLYCIRRKRQPIDGHIGPSYRKLEIICNIAILYLLIFIGAFRILQDVAGISLFPDLAFFVFASVLVQILGILGIRYAAVSVQ